jgi:hypothetical protein
LNELGNNTNLFASVDETSANDNDYIESGESPSADITRLRFSDPTLTPVSEPFRVRYRYAKTGSGNINLIVRLLQGGTTIATWTHNNISSTLTTTTQTLTTPQFSSISNFNDLRVELQADAA